MIKRRIKWSSLYEWTWLISGILLNVLLFSFGTIDWITALGASAAIAGIASVFLGAKRLKISMPFGLMETGIFTFLLIFSGIVGNSVGEIILGVVYGIYLIPILIYAYFNWKASEEDNLVIPKYFGAKKMLIILTSAMFIATWITTLLIIFVGVGNGIYIEEATLFISVFSAIMIILGITLMANRYSEQWIVWIMLNILMILFYTIKILSGNYEGWEIFGLVMYAYFLINSFYGYFNWKNKEKLTEFELMKEMTREERIVYKLEREITREKDLLTKEFFSKLEAKSWDNVSKWRYIISGKNIYKQETKLQVKRYNKRQKQLAKSNKKAWKMTP